MLSRDTIKTCESLRYSEYSDSESAVYLGVSWFVSWFVSWVSTTLK